MKIFQLVFFVLFTGAAMHASAQEYINPPFSMIDMNVAVADGRAYAFTGTDCYPFLDEDDQKFHMPYWRIFSSTDLTHWEFESYIDPTDTYMGESDRCWAGHGIKHNGKWYYYFSNGSKDTGVVVADSIKGPWKDALGKPLLPRDLTPTAEYDPCTFIDDDGRAYIIFGVRGAHNYHIAELNPDMISLKETPRPLGTLNVPADSNKADAPFMHKHGGKYYLSWRTSYGVSDNIYGPYTYLGEQTAAGHLGFFDYNNQNFVNYAGLKKGYRIRYRFSHLAYVQYHDDGRIAAMEPLIKEHGVGQYDAEWPRIEAEWFMGMSDGPKKGELPTGGFEVRNLKNGDFLRYPNIHNCPRSPVVEINYSSANAKGGTISIRAYAPTGPEIGRADFASTGSWTEYRTVSIPLDHTVPPGSLSLAFVFEGIAGQELIRVDAFNVRSESTLTASADVLFTTDINGGATPLSAGAAYTAGQLADDTSSIVATTWLSSLGTQFIQGTPPPVVSAAKDATVKVRMGDIMQVRPVSLIGGNTEDLNFQLYGGLYSQLLHGEAFEEEIGVDFLGLTDKEKLQVWVRRDGRNQPFLWLFNGRDYPAVDDVGKTSGSIEQEPGKKKKGKGVKPVTVGPLIFKGPYLSVNQLPGDLGKQLLKHFAGSEQISRQWNKVQSETADGSFTLVREGQFTGDQAQQISFINGSGEWGIDNAGLHRGGIKFEKDKPYEGILRVKSDKKQSLNLSLRDEHGKVLAEQEVKLKADPETYQRVEFTLTPNTGTTAGRFALVLREPGTVTVDYAFLQSGSWGRFHGLPIRSEMADAIKSMTVAAIRYNGSMVNRSPDGHLYKWKNMIGPRDERVPYHGWFNPYASHGFTFFEFMDFCEILDIDCMFGIRIDETEQDARDLVDYCLGSKDTEWGRTRIELGHPKPYRLQMVQIGNEEKGNPEYAERVKILAGAIWDENPDVQIALSLNVRGWERGDDRAVHLLDIARFAHGRGQGHKLVLDAHYHSTVDHADTGLANFVGIDMHDYLAEEIPGFSLRLWPMEENGSRCDWDRGLAHAHNLNTFNRLPLCVERTGTANTFQAWDKQITWDQGRIHFTPEKIFYQPSYYVDRMFGVEWLPVVLNVASSAPLLDVTAKTNEKGDVLTLYVANIGTEAVDAAFEISGFTPSKVEVMRIGSPDHEAHNTPENPTAIIPVKVDWDPATGKMQIPGDSFTTIRFAGSAFSGFDPSTVKGSASQSGAAEVKLSVDTGKVTHRVDPKIYGHFLEHIYHSCNGGLWGELIWNRSFEGGGTGGTWSRQDDCLIQGGAAADTRLVFGSPHWQDYEFTVEARKTGGNEGFLILLRALNNDEFYWANLGGWGNRGHGLERGIKGKKRWGGVTRRHDGQIEEDRWYRIRARCEGPRIQIWLDDVLVIDYTDDGKGAPRGQAGVGTWSTQAQFRNFKVTALDGRTLHEGIPPIPGGNPVAVPGWYTVGSARVSTSTESPLNGEKCKMIETGSKAGGLAQQPMKINAGETYRGSLWIRGEAPAGLSVQLMDGGTVLARQTLPVPSAQWKELPIDLKPTGSSDDAVLQIMVPPAGKVWLDQVRLMPDSWREAGGFRPDLLQAIADLKPPVIRWPGGCYASPYRWKDGIGPQYKRGPHPKSMWDDKEVNSFGTDEFVAMCRRVGAEPLIVINIGTPQWNQDVLDNDFLQEALDWLEYCNGPADSKWGRVRAANGHLEPYNVKYWEIDNETWKMGAEAYAAAVNRFGSAMRTADPTIRLAACGSGGYNQDWNRVIISQSGRNFDYISTHHYEKPDNYVSGPKQDEAFFRELKTVIDAGPNPDIKVYCSEWNAQSTDWKTGLYCGGILNVFERCGDFFEIGGPALFLRHVSATKWDNAFINFDRRTWFPAPNYVVMKLWRDHFAPNFLALDGQRDGADIVATKSEDGRTVYLKAVNPTAVAKRVAVQLTGGFKPKSATMELVAPGGLAARNSLTQPNAVHPESASVVLKGGTLTFELPAYSAGVVTLTAK